MKETIRANAVISGRVQGVCFRLNTKRTADKYGVYGWVKNRPDGKVEAVFEGEKKSVESVLKWCHKGPVMSRVDSVDITIEEDAREEFFEFQVTF